MHIAVFGGIAMRAIICDLSGPTRCISVNGRLYLFEIPQYCGAFLLNKDGSERRSAAPRRVWDAISWWAQQGERIGDDGLCIWDYPGKEILEHIAGLHYKLVGFEPPVRGS